MRTNQEITLDVMKELKYDPSLSSDHIGISVTDDGVVTLAGYVPNFLDKWAAERAAERVSGVKAIADELEVLLDGEVSHNDSEIAHAVENALEWHVSVPEDIKAIVDEGWVTLKGTVDWGFQKDAAEDAVRPLHGVMGVRNEITVKPKVKASDIQQKIEDALKRSASLEAKDIDVDVDGGRVTLRGTVNSYDEYWSARDAAWAAPGVYDVENDLTVRA